MEYPGMHLQCATYIHVLSGLSFLLACFLAGAQCGSEAHCVDRTTAQLIISDYLPAHTCTQVGATNDSAKDPSKQPTAWYAHSFSSPNSVRTSKRTYM